ncbi:hypothetical protein QL285_031824 [Trifolium repens]|nr:hypothetical protein QL285_031824 [Trifolium repens]
MEGQDPIVYFNVEKQVLVVAPMNQYMRLAEQIDVLVTKQINEKIDGFVKQGGWNEFYIARGRTCSETVSKQGEANDGNCNNGYCSGCSSSIVRHASELNAGFGKHEIIALNI